MEVLHIKNMVCPRCIMAVRETLETLDILCSRVSLGRVELEERLPQEKMDKLETSLLNLGFEVLKDKELQSIERIKNLLIQMVNEGSIPFSFSLSAFLPEHLLEDYSRLSHLFSSLEGITIERFFIQLKIEKVKEWLSYGEYNISEASYKLGYSSVQHLSTQFKKITGMTPSAYKTLKEKPRKSLDSF